MLSKWVAGFSACLVCMSLATAQEVTMDLEYAPAPVDNPLKGLVPYSAKYDGRFPHSLEFNYLPLSRLVVGPEQYDWEPLEQLLNDISGRGHQAVFRIYMEYPGKKEGIPNYLVEQGLKVHRYTYTETQPLPPAPIATPDYEDPRLRQMLSGFISALGAKYDGDPRIGFITAGLLGTWGEWHTYPRSELFASKTVQSEVMDAYESAFQVTPVLLRYPAGEKTWGKAPNAERRMGYHDDSFAWATLETGRSEDDWYFVPALKSSGAMDKWKTQPIGGEIRPEAWGLVFDPAPRGEKVQDFRTCVETTHATWLMDSGMFRRKETASRIERAEEEVRRMGYEFHIPRVTMTRLDGRVAMELLLENRGVAPFYYDWHPEFSVLEGSQVTQVHRVESLSLRGILPGPSPTRWKHTMDAASGSKILLRLPNALPHGAPVRFANREQDLDAPGWLTLGQAP